MRPQGTTETKYNGPVEDKKYYLSIKNRTPVLVIKTSVSTSSPLLGNQIRISHSLMDAVKKNWIIILIWLGGYKK